MSQDLWGQKAAAGKVARQASISFFNDFIPQLKRHSKSQGSVRPGPWIHCIAGHQGLNAEQTLQNQHFVKKVAPQQPNKQTSSHPLDCDEGVLCRPLLLHVLGDRLQLGVRLRVIAADAAEDGPG